MHSGLSIRERHPFRSQEFENRSQDFLSCPCFHKKVKNILKNILKNFGKKFLKKNFFRLEKHSQVVSG